MRLSLLAHLVHSLVHALSLALPALHALPRRLNGGHSIETLNGLAVQESWCSARLVQARSVMDVVGAAHAPPRLRRCFLKLWTSSPMW